MRVGFVYSEMETLGIEYLSSCLKQHGHDTTLFFDPQLFNDTITRSRFMSKIFSYERCLFEEIKSWRPDFLVFSILSTNYQWAFDFCAKIKRRMRIPAVFGGVHPTLCPEDVLREKCVDFVVEGEGEGAICDFANNFHDKEALLGIPNLWSKSGTGIRANKRRPLIKDLDCLPFPDKDMFYRLMPYLSRNYTIITGRGCPHLCSFCCNHALRKNSPDPHGYLRRRTPENVIAELEWAVKRYTVENVFFDDSSFTYDKEWLKKFSALYNKHVKLRCFCWAHPAEVDEERVFYLNRMNCKAVEMGVECINPQIRSKWLRRNHSNEQIESALRLFKKNKIFCITDNIVGLPEEGIADLENMVAFYNRTRPGKIYVFELRCFPATDMASLYGEYVKKNLNTRQGTLPFTLPQYRNKLYKQINFLILAIQFLPKKMVAFLLKKRWYRFFPAINAYNFMETIPYIVNFFKRRKYWFPIRGTRYRYVHYGLKMASCFLRMKN